MKLLTGIKAFKAVDLSQNPEPLVISKAFLDAEHMGIGQQASGQRHSWQNGHQRISRCFLAIVFVFVFSCCSICNYSTLYL